MYSNVKTMVASLAALGLLAAGAAFAANRAEVNGMIVSRTGGTLIVKTSDAKVTVVLDDSTQTQDKKGLFGLEKQQLGDAVLIPGLKVEIDGLPGEQGQVVAKTITVDGDDLETAEMIQSGLHPTAQQVAANVQTLEAHQQKLAGHQQGIEANKQGIEANQQGIEANKQGIEANQQGIAATNSRLQRT